MSKSEDLRDSDEASEDEEEDASEIASSEEESGSDDDRGAGTKGGGGGSRGGSSSASKKRSRQAKAAATKRARRNHMNGFIDDMAEVDDDDEEDYDEQDRANATELSAMERDMHERIKRRQQQSAAFMKQSLEEQAEQIMRRHGARLPRQNRVGDGLVGLEDDDRYGEFGGAGAGDENGAGDGDYVDDDERMDDTQSGFVDPEVAQQALLPGISDKSLFVCECQTGKENQLCLSLMNKAIFFKSNGKEFGVTSVVVPAGTKGFIYMEAMNEPAVRAAISGLRGMYHSKLKKVPIPDMTAVLSVRNETRRNPVRQGQFVRLRRKPYKDDLAKVVEVLLGSERAVVQFIPRIDFASLSADPETARARKSFHPPQRFFNPEEIKQASEEAIVERRRFQGNGEHMDFFQGNFHLNGFVMKEVNVNTWIRADKVNPTLEELQKFKSRRQKKDPSGFDDSDEERPRGEEDKESELMEDLAMAQAMEPSSEAPLFAKGDTVVVVKGDLMELMGRVLGVKQNGQSVSDAIVRIQPLVEELADEIVEVRPDQLEKYLKVGTHVRVIDGRFTGETGTILKVVKNADTASRAMVLTDMSSKEIEVHISQLQETPEVSTGLDSLQGYELYDLVMLGPNEVGVICSVDREDLGVVNNTGKMKRIRPQEIRGKRNTQSRRAFVVDSQQNQLEVDNVVDVVEGPHVGSKGTIKHIDRTTLFLHSRTHTANAGIFPVRARSAQLAGKMNKAQAAIGYMGEINATAKNDVVKEFRNRNDEMIAKTVKVIRGQYKGLLGQVIDATDTHVKVELHSKLKKVTISRNQVKAVGDRSGAYAGSQFSKPRVPGDVPGTPYLTMQTPVHGSQTPIHGSQTPMHGPQTPMHGSQTPMHGSQTPLHGSQTPIHGSQTPLGAGNQTPTASGGQTPLYGSQTPLHGSHTPMHGTGGETPDSWRDNRDQSASSRHGWDYSSRGHRAESGYGSRASPATTPDGSGAYTPSSDGYGRRGGGGAGEYNDPGFSPLGSSPGSPQTGGYTPNSAVYSPSATLDSEMGSPRGALRPVQGWTRDGVCIEVIATGSRGYIVSSRQGVTAGHEVELTVELDDLGVRALTPDEVRPVAPKARDPVLVVGTSNDGKTGILKSIDGKDGSVKYDGEAGRDILPLQNILRRK